MQDFADWMADLAHDPRYDIVAALVPFQYTRADVEWVVKSLNLPESLIADLLDSALK